METCHTLMSGVAVAQDLEQVYWSEGWWFNSWLPFLHAKYPWVRDQPPQVALWCIQKALLHWSSLCTVLELIWRPHEVWKSAERWCTTESTDPTLWCYMAYHFHGWVVIISLTADYGIFSSDEILRLAILEFSELLRDPLFHKCL